MLYVIKHGGIIADKTPTMASKDPEKPNTIELDPVEAKKMDPDGFCFQPKAEYDAELSVSKAAAEAKAKASKAVEAEQEAAAKKAAAEAKAKKAGDK